MNVSKNQLIRVDYMKLLSALNVETSPPIILNGSPVSYSESVRSLGIIIDKTLSWTSYIHAIIRKAVTIIHKIKGNVNYIPKNIKKLLVTSLVFPVIDYCAVAYNDLSDILNTKLQRIQNACLRFIYNVNIYDHITPLYKREKMLKLKEKRTLAIAVLLMKILKTKAPTYLYKSFKYMNDVHNRSNRFTDLTLQIPRHRTTKFNKSFVCSAVRIYNEFHLHKFRDSSMACLKQQLTERLLQVYN